MCAEPLSGEVVLTSIQTSNLASLQRPSYRHFGRVLLSRAVTSEIEVSYKAVTAAGMNFHKEFIVAVEFEAKGDRERLCNSCKMQPKSFKAPSLMSQGGVRLSSK